MICRKGMFANGDIAWELSDYPLIKEETGELGVVEYGKNLSFEVKRMFFLRNIVKGAERGFHAHKELKQVIMCLHGSFLLKFDDGSNATTIEMNCSANQSIYLDGRVWREMSNFSSDAVMVVLCDREYEYDEVVRDYEIFKNNLKGLISD